MFVLYVYDYDADNKILRKPGNRMFLECGTWIGDLSQAEIFFSREEAREEKEKFDAIAKKPIEDGPNCGWGQAIKILKLTPAQQRLKFESLERESRRRHERYHVLMEELGAAIHKAINS